jgi:hypothetical protein
MDMRANGPDWRSLVARRGDAVIAAASAAGSTRKLIVA